METEYDHGWIVHVVRVGRGGDRRYGFGGIVRECDRFEFVSVCGRVCWDRKGRRGVLRGEADRMELGGNRCF